MLFLMPFYLINGLHHSASTTGMLMAIIPFSILIISPLSGWISDKSDPKVLRISSTILICFALFLLSNLDADSSSASILFRLGVYGIGVGIFDAPTHSYIMGSVPGNYMGTASAMISTSRRLGLAIGTALAGTIFSARQFYYEHLLTSTVPDSTMLHKLSIVGSFQDTLLLALIISVIGILCCLISPKTHTNVKSPALNE